jgi:hypothetical protein
MLARQIERPCVLMSIPGRNQPAVFYKHIFGIVFACKPPNKLHTEMVS